MSTEGRGLKRGVIPSPEVVYFCGWGMYLIIFMLAPVEIVGQIGTSALLFLVLAGIAFLFGARFAAVIRLTPNPSNGVNNRFSPAFVSAFTILVILLIALRVYERLEVRSLSFEGDFLSRRDAVEASAGGLLSLLSVATVPACFLLLFVYLHAEHYMQVSKFAVIVAIGVFLIPGLEMSILGSRSVMLVTLALGLLYALYFSKLRIGWRSWLLLLVAVFAFALWSANIFIDRIELMRLPLAYSLVYSSYAHFVPGAPEFLELIEANETSEYVRLCAYAWVHFSQYYIHGLFEFSNLQDSFESAGHYQTYGAYMFFPAFKLLAPVFGVSDPIDFIVSATARPGVWVSSYGIAYQDFKWGGIVVYLILGLWAGLMRRKLVEQGEYSLAPLYFYILVVVFFAPVTDLISSALGLYLLTGFLAFHWFCRLSTQRSGTEQTLPQLTGRDA